MTRRSSSDASARPRAVRWALRYAWRRRPVLIGLSAASLAQVGLGLLRPWPMVIVVDYALEAAPLTPILQTLSRFLPGSGSPSGLIGWCVAASVLLFLLSWVAGVLVSVARVSLRQRMTFDLAADLLGRLQQLSLQFHGARRVGDNLRRVTGDASCLSTILIDAFLPVATAVVSLAAMLGILWRIDPILTAWSLVVVPWMAVGLRRFAGRMSDQSYHEQEAQARIFEEVEQTLTGISLVQSCAMEIDQDRRFRRCAADSLVASLSLTRTQIQFTLWMSAGTALGTAAILFLGTRHAWSGDLTVGSMILFLSYLGALYAPLETLMYSSSTIQGTAGSLQRVAEVFASQDVIRDRPGARALKRAEGALRFERVRFGYLPDRPVLEGIDLDIRPGETLALVGATGAGKSTLVSLVPRFRDPWSGRILLDGVDLRDLRLRDLRRQVAVVLQDPFLFRLSVAENIAYGCPDAAREQVEAAARAAQAHEFISGLAQGYDTRIGERGATLSGGERQRIAIARALLLNAPILVLDEPTSALDVETERDLMSALERLTANRTTLLIAHRLSTVAHADRVAMLDGGRVVEFGPHQELLAAGGTYASWWALQSGDSTPPSERANDEP